MVACSTGTPIHTAHLAHRELIGFTASPNGSTSSLNSTGSAVSTTAVWGSFSDKKKPQRQQIDVVGKKLGQRKQCEAQYPTYFCENSGCNRTFHDQALWRQHIVEHFVEAYPSYGGTAMASSNALRNYSHSTDSSCIIQQRDAAEQHGYHCQNCDGRFASLDGLKRHLPAAHSIRQCPNCHRNHHVTTRLKNICPSAILIYLRLCVSFSSAKFVVKTTLRKRNWTSI